MPSSSGVPVVVQLHGFPLALVVDRIEAHDCLEEGMQREVCIRVDRYFEEGCEDVVDHVGEHAHLRARKTHMRYYSRPSLIQRFLLFVNRVHNYMHVQLNLRRRADRRPHAV